MSEAQKVTPASTKFSRPRLGFVLACIAAASIFAGVHYQITDHNGTQLDSSQSSEYSNVYIFVATFFLVLLIHLVPLIYLYITTINNWLIYLAAALLPFASLSIIGPVNIVLEGAYASSNLNDDLHNMHLIVLCYSLFLLLYLFGKSSNSRLLSRLGYVNKCQKSVAQPDSLLLARKALVAITVISTAVLAAFYSQINQYPEAAYAGDYPSPFPSLLQTLIIHSFVVILLQSPALYAYLTLFTNRMATYLGGAALLVGNLVAFGTHYIFVNRSEPYYMASAPAVWVILVPTSLIAIHQQTISKKRDQRPQMTFQDSEKLNLSIPPPPR